LSIGLYDTSLQNLGCGVVVFALISAYIAYVIARVFKVGNEVTQKENWIGRGDTEIMGMMKEDVKSRFSAIPRVIMRALLCF
jgi:cell division protein FtsL